MRLGSAQEPQMLGIIAKKEQQISDSHCTLEKELPHGETVRPTLFKDSHCSQASLQRTTDYHLNMKQCEGQMYPVYAGIQHNVGVMVVEDAFFVFHQTFVVEARPREDK